MPNELNSTQRWGVKLTGHNRLGGRTRLERTEPSMLSYALMREADALVAEKDPHAAAGRSGFDRPPLGTIAVA